MFNAFLNSVSVSYVDGQFTLTEPSTSLILHVSLQIVLTFKATDFALKRLLRKPLIILYQNSKVIAA